MFTLFCRKPRTSIRINPNIASTCEILRILPIFIRKSCVLRIIISIPLAWEVDGFLIAMLFMQVAMLFMQVAMLFMQVAMLFMQVVIFLSEKTIRKIDVSPSVVL